MASKQGPDLKGGERHTYTQTQADRQANKHKNIK